MSIIICCLRQHIFQPGRNSRNAITRQPKLHSDFIGSAKADAIHILCQLIGIFTNDLDRFLAILLIDARCQIHRHIMGLQKEVEFFDFVLFSPGFSNLLAILHTYPFYLAQSFRLLFDNRQGLLTKVLDDASGFLWPNALNQSRTQVAGNAFWRSWQALSETGNVELTAILRVLLPFSFDRQQFANVHTWESSNNGRQIIAKYPPPTIGPKPTTPIILVP